jgi:L-amino acid N-acyltransferase YncA
MVGFRLVAKPPLPHAMAAFIRLATLSDAPQVAAIYRSAVTDSVISFEAEPPDAAAMGERIRSTLALLPWVVCEAGAVRGYAYATRFRERAAYQWSAEVSAYVAADARGAGVGRALYTSLFAILVLQGYRNAYAGITLPNEASVGMHEAAGFTPIGVYRSVGYKFGAWHDVGWFERQLAPREGDPAPPVALPRIADRPDLAAALATGERHLRL